MLSPRDTPGSPSLNARGPLSSDIQARIMAFQQKRANKPPAQSPPPLNLHGDFLSAPNIPQDHSKPPVSMRSYSQNDTTDLVLDQIPSPLASSPRDAATPSLLNQKLARLQLSPEKTFELSKKPSLLERRGMNINLVANSPTSDLLSSPVSLTKSASSAASLGSAPPSASTTAPVTPGNVSRRTSGKKKPNFTLNLGDLAPPSASASAPASAASATRKKPQLQGLFANYSKYVDIKSGLLNFAGKASLHSKGVDFSSGSSFRISLDELEFIDEIGHGNYGTVSKVLHKPTSVIMAMKEVRLELDETKFTQILMELEILHKCDSPYIVDFYGAFFVEGAVYMCMEYMDGGSLDKIYGKDLGTCDEPCLAYIAECVILGLKELKDVHNIIHRDIKPTNILVNTLGKVKLCDFGVSGNLVASLAKTNIGCQSYMAPERIKSATPDDNTYSTQSDIWSLGLTLLEITMGAYPYPAETYDNIFSQLSAIVDGEPPKLDTKRFSKQAQMFVKSCLNKNPDLRPSYAALLKHPWIVGHHDIDPHMSEIVTEKVKLIEERRPLSRSNSSKLPRNIPVAGNPSLRENVQSLLKHKVNAPALHRGGLPQHRWAPGDAVRQRQR